MKVIFISSECVPFIKTGGLADVVGALPRALTGLGAEAAVIQPKYSMIHEQYRAAMVHLTDFQVRLGWRNQYLGVEMLEIGGVKYYFIDNEYYFKQNYVYSSGDFETERFCFFCLGAMELIQRLDIIPNILHLNDWQSGMMAMLLRTRFAADERWARVRTVFTIHNLRYQGLMNPVLVNDLLGVGQEALEKVEYFCNASAMKAGIIYSDEVTTVSPTYAEEICTPQYGETLDGLIRAKGDRVTGILNGIDRTLYNPWTDKCIAARFSKNQLKGKKKCKAALQSELSLTMKADAPVIAMISRLTNQKGLDLAEAVMPGLLDLGAQIVILGMGDAHYETKFASMQDAYPGRFAFRAEMNDALARRIYAGSDMFLMPSAFEPCGLSQMLALRYASIPIVRETGGLKDSVQPYNRFTGEGNGFSFSGYSADELYGVVKMAVELYGEGLGSEDGEWQRLAARAAAADFGWDASAKSYMRLYKSLS